MAEKKKSKFTVTGSASQPMNVAPYYQCAINVPGEWKTADRNGTDVSDREGWGKKGVVVFYPTSGSKLCAPNPPYNTNDGQFIDLISTEIKQSKDYIALKKGQKDDIDQFLDWNRTIVEEVATNRYPEDEFLSFEWELKYFYQRLRKTSLANKSKLEICLHFLFCGMCKFYTNNYPSAKWYFNEAKQLSNKLGLKYIESVINNFSKHLDILDQRKKILILVSPNKEMNKFARAAQSWLLRNKWNINNYNLKAKSSLKYGSVEEMLEEASTCDIVFFVGHGGNHFMLMTKKGVVALTPDIIKSGFDKIGRKPRIFGVFSCAYESYNTLAMSKYFDNLLISTNSGDEHSEIFIKAFINAIEYTNNVVDATNLGRLALMCRMSGANQMELYQNDKKLLDHLSDS